MILLIALSTAIFFSISAFKVGKYIGEKIGYEKGYKDCFDEEWD